MGDWLRKSVESFRKYTTEKVPELNVETINKECASARDQVACRQDKYFKANNMLRWMFGSLNNTALDANEQVIESIDDACPDILSSDSETSLFFEDDQFASTLDTFNKCRTNLLNLNKFVSVTFEDIISDKAVKQGDTQHPKVVRKMADAVLPKYQVKYAEAVFKWAQINSARFSLSQLQEIAAGIFGMLNAKDIPTFLKYADKVAAVDQKVRDAAAKAAAEESAKAPVPVEKGFVPSIQQSTKNDDGNIEVGSSIGIAKEVETKNFVFSAGLNWDLAKLTNVTKDDVGTAIKGKSARDVANSGFGGAEISFSKIAVSVDGKDGNVKAGDTTMTLKASYEIENASAGVGFDIALNSTDEASKATHTITPTLLWTTPVDDLGFNPKVSLKYAYNGDKTDFLAATSIEGSICYFSKAEDFKYGFDASLSLRLYKDLFLTPKFGYGDPFGVDNVPNAVSGDYNWKAGIDFSWKPKDIDVFKGLSLGFNWTYADANYNYGGDGGDYDVENSAYIFSLSARFDLGVMTFDPAIGWAWYNTSGLEDVEGSTNGFFFGFGIGL